MNSVLNVRMVLLAIPSKYIINSTTVHVYNKINVIYNNINNYFITLSSFNIKSSHYYDALFCHKLSKLIYYLIYLNRTKYSHFGKHLLLYFI